MSIIKYSEKIKIIDFCREKWYIIGVRRETSRHKNE